jgi:muconolactone delta-isomerase
VLVFVDFRVNPKEWSLNEMWDEWERETEAALEAVEAGKIVAIYKVSGQRRVLAVLDVESTDELDQIIMAGLPIAHNLEIAEILPVREYAAFAEDVRQRWGAQAQT